MAALERNPWTFVVEVIEAKNLFSQDAKNLAADIPVFEAAVSVHALDSNRSTFVSDVYTPSVEEKEKQEKKEPLPPHLRFINLKMGFKAEHEITQFDHVDFIDALQSECITISMEERTGGRKVAIGSASVNIRSLIERKVKIEGWYPINLSKGGQQFAKAAPLLETQTLQNPMVKLCVSVNRPLLTEEQLNQANFFTVTIHEIHNIPHHWNPKPSPPTGDPKRKKSKGSSKMRSSKSKEKIRQVENRVQEFTVSYNLPVMRRGVSTLGRTISTESNRHEGEEKDQAIEVNSVNFAQKRSFYLTQEVENLMRCIFEFSVTLKAKQVLGETVEWQQIGKGSINTRRLCKPGERRIEAEIPLISEALPKPVPTRIPSRPSTPSDRRKSYKFDQWASLSEVTAFENSNTFLRITLEFQKPLNSKIIYKFSDVSAQSVPQGVRVTKRDIKRPKAIYAKFDNLEMEASECLREFKTFEEMQKSARYHRLRHDGRRSLIELIQNRFRFRRQQNKTVVEASKNSLRVSEEDINSVLMEARNEILTRNDPSMSQDAQLNLALESLRKRARHAEVNGDLHIAQKLCLASNGGGIRPEGDLDYCRQSFIKALEVDPCSVPCLLGLAAILCETDEVEKAEVYVLNAAKYLPNHPLVLGMSYVISDLMEEDKIAESNLEKTLEALQTEKHHSSAKFVPKAMNGADWDLYSNRSMLLGNISYLKRDISQVMIYLSNFFSNFDLVRLPLHFLSKCWTAAGQMKIRFVPNLPSALPPNLLLVLAETATTWTRAGKSKKSEKLLRKILESECLEEKIDDKLGREIRSRIWVELGVSLVCQNVEDKAVDAFKTSLSYMNCPRASLLLASLYCSMDNAKMAKAVLLPFTSSDSAYTLALLAYSLLEAEELDEATTMAAKAAATNPSNPLAWGVQCLVTMARSCPVESLIALRTAFRCQLLQPSWMLNKIAVTAEKAKEHAIYVLVLERASYSRFKNGERKRKSSIETAFHSECFLTDEWKTLRISDVKSYNYNTKLIQMQLPDPSVSLGLPVCACILAKIPGTDIIRPYTPISSTFTKGSFTLLIKIYPDGKFTQRIDRVGPGDELEFKFIAEKNKKEPFPFRRRKVVMLAGGTGITPMYQALLRILETGDGSEVTLIFGNVRKKDILLKEHLDEISEKYPSIDVHYVLSSPEKDDRWKGETGYISAKMISKLCPKPAEDPLVFVCGPPQMYKALCGPRTENVLTGTLKQLGFTEEQVIKF
ncbi:hypothetical protein AAMO2058_000463300 [Amorphochlora amoebiformis]